MRNEWSSLSNPQVLGLILDIKITSDLMFSFTIIFLVMDDPLLINNPSFGLVQDKLMTFTESKDDLTDKIDFVVCLGGDGTLLYASSLFQQSVPPIMAFHLGSLGFLTPFKFEDFRQQVCIYFHLIYRDVSGIKLLLSFNLFTYLLR